jgi:hypothetical protein
MTMTRARTPNPVTFDVERAPVFQRAHVVVRIVLLAVLGWITHPFGVLWLAVPAVAAILITRKGGQRYLDEDGPTVAGVLGWILSLLAYLALLTDELPIPGQHPVRFQVERSGSPTANTALKRILYAIPSLIVLTILTFVGAIVWVIAAVRVLVDETYPESLWRFLFGILRWEAWVLAYLASLTDHYPPFSLETGSVGGGATQCS